MSFLKIFNAFLIGKKNPCQQKTPNNHFIWHYYFVSVSVPHLVNAALLSETYSPPSHLLMHGSYNSPLWFSRRRRERPCSAISLSSSAASQPVMNEPCISDQYYLRGITSRLDSHTTTAHCSLCHVCLCVCVCVCVWTRVTRS